MTRARVFATPHGPLDAFGEIVNRSGGAQWRDVYSNYCASEKALQLTDQTLNLTSIFAQKELTYRALL